MPITIVSKRDGFRRCGIAHPAAPTTYPEGRFTDDELARLEAEPMLVVTRSAPIGDATGDPMKSEADGTHVEKPKTKATK